MSGIRVVKLEWSPLESGMPPITTLDRPVPMRYPEGAAPPVTPAQCKPFADAAADGWQVMWPYASRLDVREQFLGQWGPEPGTYEVTQFAPGHFSFKIGYRLATQPGIALRVEPCPGGLADIVPGIIETDWYPKPPFLVVRVEAGYRYHLAPGDPLCVLRPVPTGRRVARPMSPARIALQVLEEEAYDKYRESNAGLQWKSDTGSVFSHAYLERSARRAREGR